MITVKVTKSLVTDDNKTFNEGQEISFNYFCKHYICTIEKICRKKKVILKQLMLSVKVINCYLKLFIYQI